MRIRISVPTGLFEAGEHLARQLGLSRSQIYTEALLAYVTPRSAARVTARLNDIYSIEPSKVDREFAYAQAQRVADEAW